MAKKDLCGLLAKHINYELYMLRETYLLLNSCHDPVIDNALVESFCIHARSLIDFYKNDQGLRAEEYTEAYCSQCVGRLPKQLVTKLNTQIAHLTGQRTDVEAEKIGSSERATLISAIQKETEHFANSLNEEYRKLLMVPQPINPTPVPGAPGASSQPSWPKTLG